MARVAGVDVVHWNPKRKQSRFSALRRVNNFGDLLGPLIVGEIVRRRGLLASRRRRGPRLLAVGSTLRLARNRDVLWGIGANGKTLAEKFAFSTLDVRAVRGPLTRDFLLGRDVEVPAVYGDPGLLVGALWAADDLRGSLPTRQVTVIPNLNDLADFDPNDRRVVAPTAPIGEVLATIAASSFVTGSSLHAIVVAESLGIPARLIASPREPLFKYEDYYRGSGRDAFEPAGSIDDAVRLGGENAPRVDQNALLASFPADLWGERRPVISGAVQSGAPLIP